MKYIFEVNVYTDGDFRLPFVPCGMTYDGSYEYTFKKVYDTCDKDKVFKDVIDISHFLKDQIVTSKDYVKEYWDDCIDEFIKDLEISKKLDLDFINIEKYMNGNYSGTEFIFKTEPYYLDCGFYVSDKELELIRDNIDQITNSMIKERILELFKVKK